MGKKGHKGHKKVQGQKAKAAKVAKKTKVIKAKARKPQSKAVKTNLKKMAFDNRKKIDSLNTELNSFLQASGKPAASASSKPPKAKRPIPDEDHDMPDVGEIAQNLASM